MSNFDTVVLDGEMGLFTTIREGDLPYYTGATEVTPSDQTQTLPTADTIVTSNITVNPVPGEYIDTTDATLDDASLLPSGVTAYADGVKYTGTAAINDDGDLVVSGDTVTVPAGFYEEPAAASVASGSATTPATSITANPSISVGNDGSITASVSATQSVTPTVSEGYVSSGTAGTITVSGSGSSQLSTQAGATITPTTSQQTAVAAGKFTTGAVIVDAMPSGTEGTPTATKGTVSNHSVAVTPSVTNTEGYISGGTKTGTAVTVSASELVSGSQNITVNNTYDVTDLAEVVVAVPGGVPTLETKSVSYTPTESQQTATVTASAGYDGLEEVDITVGAISSSYVGSAIDRRDSTDLSASGATVTAPAGYYAAAASKAVASGSASTPATTITANPSISVDSSGLITATTSASQSVTPTVSAGYVSSGTSGTVTVSGSATEQLTTQAAQTIHPSTTDQTIASGKYLTGTQTIKAVTTTNLTADNIVSGVTVEVGDADDPDCVASVTGTASGGGLEEKEVNFYDYDGELLYAYDAAEFLALDAFPANPTHEGLTAQGWNWTLAGAKTYVTKYGFLQIGQTYEPTDGAAHVHIEIPDMEFATVTFGGIQPGWLEWGDGSARETITSATSMSHTYASVGSYIVRLYANANSWNLSIPSEPTRQLIKEINIPKNQGSYANMFMDVWNLERFSIPKGAGFNSTPVNFLRNSTFLQGLVLPLDFNEFSNGTYNINLKAICLNENLTGNCKLPAPMTYVTRITCPSGVTKLYTNGGQGDYSIGLKVLIVPDGVTTFGKFNMVINLETLRFPESFSGGISDQYTLTSVEKLKELVVSATGDIPTNCFNSWANCMKVIIGSNVTSLGFQSFQNFRMLKEIHMKPTIPPTRSVYNFNGKPNICTIYVPYSADHSVLAAYQSATNWSNDAALMVEEQP